MRFIDSNVIIYAYLRTKRKLSETEKELKESSKSIIERIEKKEKAVTTVIHLSEVANIIESISGIENSVSVMNKLLNEENLVVESVRKNDCILGTEHSETKNISVNDGIALIIMENLKIDEIYSFDTHFDKVPWIKRIVK